MDKNKKSNYTKWIDEMYEDWAKNNPTRNLVQEFYEKAFPNGDKDVVEWLANTVKEATVAYNKLDTENEANKDLTNHLLEEQVDTQSERIDPHYNPHKIDEAIHPYDETLKSKIEADARSQWVRLIRDAHKNLGDVEFQIWSLNMDGKNLNEIAKELKKIINNKNDQDLYELVSNYYDANIRDEWHSFGDSHYGLTNNSDIEVIAYLVDKIVGTYTSGYTMTSDEANFRVEDEVEWTPPDDHLISYMDGNYMLHKSFEKGNFIDIDLYLDEEVDFDIKNLILEFEYEGGPYEYYCFPEKIISRIVCVDADELEVGVIEKSGGTVNLYDKVSSTGKGIEVEICIDGEIVFSEG